MIEIYDLESAGLGPGVSQCKVTVGKIEVRSRAEAQEAKRFTCTVRILDPRPKARGKGKVKKSADCGLRCGTAVRFCVV